MIDLGSVNPSEPLACIGVHDEPSDMATIEPAWPDRRAGRTIGQREYHGIAAYMGNAVRPNALGEFYINRADNQHSYAPGGRVNQIIDNCA
jgi:hypothetical protein